MWYAENISFLLDMKILFMTVFKVLRNSDNENIGASVVQHEENKNDNVLVSDEKEMSEKTN